MKQLKKIKIFLACFLLFSVFPSAFAEKGTFLNEIRFVQYLDENIALEEVITEITVFTIAIKKLTDNARKTVFEEWLVAILFKPSN